MTSWSRWLPRRSKLRWRNWAGSVTCWVVLAGVVKGVLFGKCCVLICIFRQMTSADWLETVVFILREWELLRSLRKGRMILKDLFQLRSWIGNWFYAYVLYLVAICSSSRTQPMCPATKCGDARWLHRAKLLEFCIDRWRARGRSVTLFWEVHHTQNSGVDLD